MQDGNHGPQHDRPPSAAARRDPDGPVGLAMGGTEVRTVPSARFPTIASAISGVDGGAGLPHVVVRILPGVYHEQLVISAAVALVGADDSLPTIQSSGPDGLKIVGPGGTGSVLRKLRLCADTLGRALSVHEASPLIEGCEIVGAGCEPVRGAPGGLHVSGTQARPVVRGCRISGHAGAGAVFSGGASGLIAACEISRCACGVWLEGGGNPLVWRNTLTGHRGAGIVVRADGMGFIMGNNVLRNGAGGILVESTRRAVTVISQNRVWANMGTDLRQSPAQAGFSAGELGALVLTNTVGKQPDDPGGAAPSGELVAAWPKCIVRRASELVAAVRDAPRNRFVLIEIWGRLELQEPLVIDRPVVLAGADTSHGGPGQAELCVAAGAAAVVVVRPGGEAAALWRLTLRLPAAQGAWRPGSGGSCVEVTAGSPTLVDCELLAGPPLGLGSPGAAAKPVGPPAGGAMATHAMRASGGGVAPLLAGCALQGAVGAGLLVESGAAAALLQCEVSGNWQGGVFLGEGASVQLEACEVSRNGHFGVVVGTGAHRAYMGRTNISGNQAGSIWHCGRLASPASAPERASALPVWLDECSLTGSRALRKGSSSPVVLAGAGSDIVLWESLFAQAADGRPMVRAESSARVLVAGDGLSGAGMAGWNAAAAGWCAVGAGETLWLDVSGVGERASPGSPPQRLSPQRAAPVQAHPAEGLATGEAWPAEADPSKSACWPDGAKADDAALALSVGRRQGAPVASTTPKDAEGSPEGDSSGPSPDPSSPQESPQARQAGEAGGDHALWLRSMFSASGTSLQSDDQNRRMLFGLLAMLSGQDRCQDVLDTVGLGGPLKSGDTVLLRGHTGRWVGLGREDAVVCNKPDRGSAMPLVLETKSSSLHHESKATFKVNQAPPAPSLRLGVTQSHEVRLIQKAGGPHFQVLADQPGTVLSGHAVCLKALWCGRTLDIEGEEVRARTTDRVTMQHITLEKLPPESEVPDPCPAMELSAKEKAWIFRRGVQFAVVDRQQLAKFLSSHRPQCQELLNEYTALWEAEWRRNWSDVLRLAGSGGLSADSASSPVSHASQGQASEGGASKRSSSRPKKTKRDWIIGMVSGVSTEDKANGDLFISALRSFFATAIRMSQLEADPVQRVVQAFADALVADAAFLECFTPSMLPEAERKTYRKPDEVLFGLTYTTLMLNTDMHNKQVGQKMWDRTKFVGAGKDCGVSGGLMMRIFKNVQKEEL